MFKQPEVQTLMLVACTPLYTNQNTSTEPALAHNSLYGLPTFIMDMNQNTSTEPALADYSLYGLPIFIVPLFFSKASLTTLMLFKVLYCSITVHILFEAILGWCLAVWESEIHTTRSWPTNHWLTPIVAWQATEHLDGSTKKAKRMPWEAISAAIKPLAFKLQFSFQLVVIKLSSNYLVVKQHTETRDTHRPSCHNFNPHTIPKSCNPLGFSSNHVTDAFVGKVYQRRRPAAGEKKTSAMDKEAGK